MKIVAVGRERTEEEKRRRHIHGDKGAKFSQGKQMCLLGEIVGTLTTSPTKDNLICEIYKSDTDMGKDKAMEFDGRTFRIRRLTPRECFRLMDVDEKYIDIIQNAGISNAQQYKLAGNSIVVACLEGIFKNLLFPSEIKLNREIQLSLF